MDGDRVREKVPAKDCKDKYRFKEKHSTRGALCMWSRIFEVRAWLGDSRLASIITPYGHLPPVIATPTPNCGFALNSVFRIMRINTDIRAEFFTAWLVSPPILTEDDRYMFFGVCSAHLFDEGDGMADKPEFYKGCFGQLVRPWEFRHEGFFVEKDPVMCFTEGGADIAVVRFFVEAEEMKRVIPREVTFLLPCSPSQYGSIDAELATIGYNSFSWFLEQAKMELEEGQTSPLSLWELYKQDHDPSYTKDHLYSKIWSVTTIMSRGTWKKEVSRE